MITSSRRPRGDPTCPTFARGTHGGGRWPPRRALAAACFVGLLGCDGPDAENRAETHAEHHAKSDPETDDKVSAGEASPLGDFKAPAWPFVLTSIGPDCLALARAASQAIPCEPALEDVVHALLQRPEEGDCREAARTLLETTTVLEHGVPPSAPSPASIIGVDPTRRTRPLSREEHDALRALPLPGIVRVRPDATPAPGVPSVDVWLDGARVLGDEAGVVERRLAPGAHELTLFHAGRRSTSCLTLDRCTTVDLIAQGHVPSRHPSVQRTPCR